ncbi:oxidoreductase [Blastococcus sp. TBT05-19]|uniref:dihydrolipoyl dehydrogenase family protein n=1 Tax=Blastococcus sp. TBT05-19 TaxID=2250581 RepID=UPI000DEB646C|nr:FAD-dependent oxidoreductase [Blastococcus sp. TBT05-19]RBY93968.1 oxidoreductase [Blastococcus sp. TBT05-19]
MTREPTSRRTWDLLVVGAGTAGLIGAQTAAGLGARVLVVESGGFGGDCLWTGCAPSKALLAAGAAAAGARRAARFGVHVDGVRIDGAEVMAAVRRAITTIEPVDSPDALRAAGVTVAVGTARFTGPRTAEIDGRPVRFRQALVATGSRPFIPRIPGLESVDVLTTETVWELGTLPARLAVVGAGASGCELAQAFARLGTEVALVESADRILPGEDPAASDVLLAALRADGVDVRTGATVDRVGEGRLVLADGTTVGFDRLLLTVGRRPRTEGLGLGAAGVDVDERGNVVVDATLTTTNPRIRAAGDVTGHPPYTHVAGVHGSLAATNAVLGLRRRVDLSAVPRVTYTSPEIAAVGEPTGALADDRRLVERPLRSADRSVTDQDDAGFSRLVVDSGHRVRGANVVGPRAGEALAELVLAVSQGLTTGDLAGAMHAYPTFADPQWNAAIRDVRRRLAGPAARRVLTVLALTRRAVLAVRR